MKRYFQPKSFEMYRNKTIYEYVGILWYKKYVPTTGDLARKWKGITQIALNRTERIAELYKYERITRQYELRHIAGAIGFIALIVVIDKKLEVFDLIFLTALNLYVNIFPIFLQRHNRIRILKVLQQNGLKSPYDIDTQ